MEMLILHAHARVPLGWSPSVIWSASIFSFLTVLGFGTGKEVVVSFVYVQPFPGVCDKIHTKHTNIDHTVCYGTPLWCSGTLVASYLG